MRRVLLVSALGVLLAGAFVLGYKVASADHRSADPQTTVVEAVRAELAARYYRTVPPAVLGRQSVSSIIAGLHDPYTEYLDRFAYSLLRTRLGGRYFGIGATLTPVSNGLRVVATQRGPARAAGLQAGDTIVRIGGVPARRLGPTGAFARITGVAGTHVRLKVLRGRRQVEVRVRRGEIETPYVASRLVRTGGHTYGYVAVFWFGEGVSERVAAELRRFPARGLDGVVLDLRDNPGGLLTEAVRTSSFFLRGGPVVTLIGAHRPRQTIVADARELVPRLPVVVLVNHGTASAAEVVAAALRDHDRAVLVGSRTFGKAVVQSVTPLSNGGALALTIARYLTPAGLDISRHGLAPSVRAADRPLTRKDEALQTAVRVLASS
jgi:carboxyl-terminal processing protease